MLTLVYTELATFKPVPINAFNMKVKLGQAVKMFFGNASLEMVYFEAIANALDADATAVNIDVTADAYNKPETINITISDNGVGFTDERYKKFSNLFYVDQESHKGLGRLVYLCYFNSVNILSTYEGTKQREFAFTESFKEENATINYGCGFPVWDDYSDEWLCTNQA